MRTRVFFFCFSFFSFLGWGQAELPLETVLQKGHTDYMRAYAFSSDSRFLVSGGFDNVLLLWDVQSGKQIRTFSGHTERIRTVVFSTDQQRILSVGADNVVRVFEVLTGRQLVSLSLMGIDQNEIYSAYYSPGNRYVYALDNRDGVWVWDAETGEEVDVFEKDFSAGSESALIHADDQKILSTNGYKGSCVVDLVSKDTILNVPFDKPHSHSFSPNGDYIAISSRKLFASVFNSANGQLVNTFKFGDMDCDGCNTEHVFSPDSRYLVTMSNKIGAILWDIESGKKIREFVAVDDHPNQLLFSSKGTYFLVSFDDDVYVFETKSGREKLHLTSDKIDYLKFQFSPDEEYIAMPNPNGAIDLWSVRRGKLIASLSGYLNTENSGGLDLSYSNWVQQSILSYIQHKRKVAISPDNQCVLIGGVDTVAMLIDIKSGRVVRTFQGHRKSVIAFDFSPDGKYIATAGADREIFVWDAATGERLKVLKGHQETVFDLQFSHSGQYIVSGAWDGDMRVWDWQKGKSGYIPFANNSPYCVGFSPNELYLVTGDLDKNIVFWERDAAAHFRTLVGHTSIPSGFDFSPDGESIVSASWDGNVKLWNVITGMLVGRMDQHSGRVYTVTYDPKNRFVASGGADGRIILWDPSKNKVLTELNGHATAVTSVAITGDGAFLISLSVDGLMKVWDLNTYQEVYSRIQLSRNEWLATNPSGYFDGSPKGLDWVNYVKGNEVVNVGSLFEKYYTPGLIERVNEKEEGLQDRGELLDEQMKNIPQITVELALDATTRGNAFTADSVYESNTDQVPLEVGLDPSSAGLMEEIRVYNNGKLVLQESLERNISFRGGDKNKVRLTVPLSNGLNELKIVAINMERTESAPKRFLVDYNGKAAVTDLYILSIGINTYKNPAYNLNYAVNDSKAFVKTIENGADSLFGTVKTFSLLNNNATKATILATIEEIKKEIGPEDVFLFYYAGHGVMSNEEAPKAAEFFIVTHDVTNLYDSPEVIRQKAISASDLMAMSISIAAEKQLFILDACHSGGAIESFAVRGSEREKALAQLARNTGTFFLTAAQDAQYANEVGKLNHGLFTYALLELLEGTVLTEGDQKVTVNELKTYVEERVPELSEMYHGSPQYPTGYSFGRDFPIVILK